MVMFPNSHGSGFAYLIHFISIPTASNSMNDEVYHHSNSVERPRDETKKCDDARWSSARSEYTTGRSEPGSEMVVPGDSYSDW